MDAERAMKAHAMPAHGLRSAYAPAAARTHAAGAVAGRLVRLPAVEAPPLESVPKASIGPIGPNFSADFAWPYRETISADMTACRPKTYSLLAVRLKSLGNFSSRGRSMIPLRRAGTGDKPDNRGYMWRQ
jgi:hypothetical protein